MRTRPCCKACYHDQHACPACACHQPARIAPPGEIPFDEPGSVESARLVNGYVLLRLEATRREVRLTDVVIGYGDVARLLVAIEQLAAQSEEAAALWKIANERAGMVLAKSQRQT